MGVDHPGRMQADMDLLVRRVVQQALATIQNSSVGRAGMRFYDGGWLRIENGGLSVTGSAIVSGSLEVTGTLNGSGTLDWTGLTRLRGPVMVTGNMTGSGDLLWSGPWELRGAGTISGNTRGTGTLTWVGPWRMDGNGHVAGTLRVTGRTDMEGILNVDGTAFLRSRVYVDDDLFIREGKLEAGNLVIDRAGASGGRIYSRGTYLQLGEVGASAVLVASNLFQAKQMRWEDGQSRDHIFSGNVLIAGNLKVNGDKDFSIPHPTKPDHILNHVVTESPVAGTEYWGDASLDENGEAVVELPDYFEALTEDNGKAVLVTPIGRPFLCGADRVKDGKVTVYGEPGREVSWLVKAARKRAHRGTTQLVEPIIGPQRKAA